MGYKLVNQEWGLLHEQESSWALGSHSPCQCGKLRLGDAHHSYIPLPSRKKGSQVLRLSWRRRLDQAGVQGCPGAVNGLNPLRPAPHNLSHTHKNGPRPLLRATTPRHQGHSTWEGVGAGTRQRVPSLTDRQGQAPWCRRPSTCLLNLHWAGREVPPAYPSERADPRPCVAHPLQCCLPCPPPLPSHHLLKAAFQAGRPLAALCCLLWALCWSPRCFVAGSP